ncbi:MAG: hypothetical protein F6J87_03140 [Spirulina sp. SIO3F2]|nr:hypothetical protein [Spirulina sp. SIO3F2]
MDKLKALIEMDKLKALIDLGIDPIVASEYQILCLPPKLKDAQSELMDTSDCIRLSKLLKEEGAKCANSYDLGLDTKSYELRGVGLWMGSIWILNHAALPVFISILSRLIWEGISRKSSGEIQKNASQDSNETNSQKVNINLNIVSKNMTTEIDYSGDATSLIKILESLKNEP